MSALCTAVEFGDACDVTPPVRVNSLVQFLKAGSVFRASVRDPGPKADKRSRELRKRVLGRHLLRHSSMEARPWSESPVIRIVNDSLGKPRVLCGSTSAPPVSFAHVGTRTWGAICPRGAAVGIDVARAAEFNRGYPFSRAFCEEDVVVTLEKTNGDKQEAAAMLWSAKEAVVKAIGCGFHLLDPLDVRVVPWFEVGSEHILRGQVRGRSLEMLVPSTRLDVPVAAVREESAWVCTALLDRAHARERGTGGDDLMKTEDQLEG